MYVAQKTGGSIVRAIGYVSHGRDPSEQTKNYKYIIY